MVEQANDQPTGESQAQDQPPGAGNGARADVDGAPGVVGGRRPHVIGSTRESAGRKVRSAGVRVQQQRGSAPMSVFRAREPPRRGCDRDQAHSSHRTHLSACLPSL